ncbi:UDP-glucuronosyltransferase 2B2 [Orussus abietinus]|uniref:UDP-glucuronosyltransferase 2B2 n=1 Tax=Orussus abietinus TaxID=222816 RepID=UPI0006260EFB|nr:UDP-glucuronosyltransferase 2B2 [Orussus abietinus]
MKRSSGTGSGSCCEMTTAIACLLLVLFPLTSVLAEYRDKRHEESGAKYNILGIFGHPGKSHFDFFRPLLIELARRGHDVTVVSHFPRGPKDESLPNYRDVSLAPTARDKIGMGNGVNVVDLSRINYSPFSVVKEVALLRAWGLQACEDALRNEDVRRLVASNDTFHVILTESFNTDCFLGFVHRFKAPFIALSSHQIMPWTQERLRDPENPSYVPCSFLGFSWKMNFLQRVQNALTVALTRVYFRTAYEWPTQVLVEEAFGPGVPPLWEIARNTSAILLNTHYSLHGARPHLPNVIDVGGLHIPNFNREWGSSKVSLEDQLPQDIRRFLDNASEGVLYFSWGSMIKMSSLPEKKLQAILRVLGSIPRKVLWKWEADDLPGKPDNVMVAKWLPQFAVLNHPNVKCFLGHGGLLGLSEAVYAQVPMVLVPMYGDQFHNVAAAEARGVAVVLPYNLLDERTFRDALDRVFNDTRYTSNSQILAKVYRERPSSPLETAVWWTEFVGRGYPVSYLRNEGAELAWYRYYLLDVVGFLLLLGLAGVFLTYRLARASISYLLALWETFVGTTRRRAVGAKSNKAD